MTGSAPAGTTTVTFRKATQPTIGVSGSYNQTLTMTSAAQDFPVWLLPPNNILRGIVLEVTGTVAGQDTSSVAFNVDAPSNIFSTFNFTTAACGSFSIVGSFDSYTPRAW